MRPLLRATTKAIGSLYNSRLSANVSSDPIPQTIHHVIPKMGRAMLGPGDLSSNNLSGAMKWSYSQNFFFAYLNKGPFMTQSLINFS